MDRLSAGQVASLGASGVIMSGTRLLGEAASGGRIYLVPAEHLLADQPGAGAMPVVGSSA